MAAGFPLFTVLGTSRIVGWNLNTIFTSTCWRIHIFNSLLYLVVHTQFFFSIIGWLKWDIMYQLFVGYQVHHFLGKEKACFICFCRFYVLLKHEKIFVNKQPGSTLSTTINGSRNWYITIKTLPFVPVETKLTRTKDSSTNILSWFWTLFNNVNPSAKPQEKGICLIFKKNVAHLAHRRALRSLIFASSKSVSWSAQGGWRP